MANISWHERTITTCPTFLCSNFIVWRAGNRYTQSAYYFLWHFKRFHESLSSPEWKHRAVSVLRFTGLPSFYPSFPLSPIFLCLSHSIYLPLCALFFSSLWPFILPLPPSLSVSLFLSLSVWWNRGGKRTFIDKDSERDTMVWAEREQERESRRKKEWEMG